MKKSYSVPLKLVFLSITLGFYAQLALGNSEKVIAATDGTKVTVVELYSSESCSSCPPADQWISKLKSHKDLWKKFVPLVFHVDYWNHLNWKDGFSSQKMTERQVAVSKTWDRPSVYTPAVVLSGREFKAWHYSKNESQFTENLKSDLGLKILEKNKGEYLIQVKGQTKGKKYNIHLAKLGFDVSSKISNGENSGRVLRHDFIVLEWKQQDFTDKSQSESFIFLNKEKSSTQFAIVAWIEEVGRPVALQAVGAYL